MASPNLLSLLSSVLSGATVRVGATVPHIGLAVDDSLPVFDAAFERVLNKLEANFYGG